ncbi:MAG: SpoIID/LytB domain-containing protein [Bacteriovoracaceae bacterium]|jgi:stage II sporulation protein D|nr:SpoIID/LytB domain-containing protein [Bacteriovoracaceae bacterium]
MSFKSTILLLLLSFLPTQLMANTFELPVQSSSPEFIIGAPTLVDLDLTKSNSAREMRVLVFPHTLKNDHRHGVPDDASRVKLESSKQIILTSLSGLSLSSTSFSIVSKGSQLIITLANGSIVVGPQKINLNGSAPIKVVRSLNVEKSHQYLGRFEVTLKGQKISVINTVTIETYLRGVVPSESISSWPLESLKAQAVAARTYALYHNKTLSKKLKNKRDYDVDDTARFQVYTGLSHVMASTDQAVLETANEVMTYKGKLIVAFFHSYSGGRTDSAINIFKQNNVPYCFGQAEIFTREELLNELSDSSKWIVNWSTKVYSQSELIGFFKKYKGTRGGFRDFSSQLELNLEVKELNTQFDSHKKILATQGHHAVTLDFAQIRSAIGWSKFPSYHYKMTNLNGTFKFRGHGWGHHVGMSQWGAMMMAKFYAKTYREILHHYYTGIKITNLQ